MTGIVFNNEQECMSLISEIDAAFNFMFKGETTTYTYCIKHPVDELYAVIVDMDDVQAMQTGFPTLIEGMSMKPEDIIELGTDWIDESIIE